MNKAEKNSADLHDPIDDISVPSSSLMDEDWGDDDLGGGFASEHTSVDPSLLDRLAALDAKKEAKAKAAAAAQKPSNAASSLPDATMRADDGDDDGGAALPAEHTINLDINDLMGSDLMGGDEGGAERTQAIDIPAILPEKTQAMEIPPAITRSGPGGAAASAAPAPPPTPKAAEPAPTMPIDPALLEEDKPDYGELSQEKTQIFTPVMDDEPTRAKLKVLQGGGQQKEYLLARDRVTMGRGTNNDILVPDIAISRQHCEIARISEGNYRVRDLNSGNGIKLNGARVLESDLFGGDRIELGSTILEFVITGPGASRAPGERKISYHPSESSSTPSSPAMSMPPASGAARRTGGNMQIPAPPPAPIPNYSEGGPNATVTHFAVPVAEPPRSGNGIIIGLIAVFAVLFLVLAGFFAIKIIQTSGTQSAPVAGDTKTAQEYYFSGVEAIKQRDWEKAEESLVLAKTRAGSEGNAQTLKDAELQLDRVRSERESQGALERGRELLEKDKFDEAIAKLETIKSGSLFYKDAREEVDKARSSYADKLVKEGEDAFTAKRFDEADKKVTLALTTLPTHKPAQELRTKIESLPTEEYSPPPRVNTGSVASRPPRETPEGGSNAAAKGNDKTTPPAGDGGAVGSAASKKGGSAPASGGMADLTPGLTLYKNKKFGEATAFFQKIASSDEGISGKKAGGLAADIPSFQQNFEAGTTAFQSNSWTTACTKLTNARRLDLKISGIGYHKASIDDMLAECNYQQARAAFNSQNYARAGVNAKLALQYKPAHPGNRELLNELEGKAKSMYIDARSKKASDPRQAKSIAQAIVAMLPQDSDTYQKAKKLLDEL